MAHFADRRAFVRHLTPVRKKRWVVYAKAPFAGPEAVLAYRSRYTHRAAISNRRLIAFDPSGVAFRVQKLSTQRSRAAAGNEARYPRVHPPLPAPRAAARVPPHSSLWPARRVVASRPGLERARALLAVALPRDDDPCEEPTDVLPPCPCCGGQMDIILTFAS